MLRCVGELASPPRKAAFPTICVSPKSSDWCVPTIATPLSDADLFARFPLQTVWRRQAGGLSGGQKRILAVALAFVGNPDLVFLDEPTTGLDVTSRQALWQAVLRYRNSGGTAVLTTHYLEEAEALATRVVVICKGRTVAEGTVDEIRARVGQSRITYRGEAREGLPGVTRIERVGEEVALLAYDADVVVRALVTVRGHVSPNSRYARPALRRRLWPSPRATFG